MSFAKAFVFGNLTKDPETRYAPSGTAIASFSVAVNEKWKDASGEYKEKVSFLQCTAFGKTADLISGRLQKGDPIFIDGKIEQQRWEKDGQQRSAIKIIVDRFESVGGRKGQATEAAGSATGGANSGVEAEDVPF